MSKSVKGTITDGSGAPVPGATVTVVGSTRGVITDMDGHYSIEVSPSDRLQFSFVGLESQTVEVGAQTVINIQLKEKIDELDEVTVVAFAKQKKESVISSISTVKPEELRAPSSNLTTALAGRVAGLISYQRSGEPGADNADFFIRGVTTFGYSKSPLILLDGVEVTSSDLARLQPDDVASFSIMKDASAAALYGARGANGVILVTTKEGREGKAKVDIRYETSISKPTDKIEIADPITYMKQYNEAVTTRDLTGTKALPYTWEKIENTERGLNPMVYPAVDWYDMLIKDQTVNHRLNMNIGGGGKVARYYLTATYNQDNGNLNVDKRNNFNNNVKLNRYLLRSNVNINITPMTEAVVRLYGTFDDYTGPLGSGATMYNYVMRASPVDFPAYYIPDLAHQDVSHILFGNYGSGDYINPYATLVKGYRDYTTSTMIAQFEMSQKLDFVLEGLKVRGLFSTNRYAYFDVQRYYNPFYYNIGSYNRQKNTYVLNPLNPDEGTEYLGYSEGTKTITSNTYFEAAVDWSHTYSEAHEIGAMLVYYQREKLNANAGSLQLSLPFRNTGLSGRFTYGYRSRYFVEANFGYNGSERFSKGHRFGFFPSIGGGWNLSNEPFYSRNMKRILPKAKIKATYGLVGNDAIGSDSDRFFYLSEVNLNNNSYGYTMGQNFDHNRPGVSISRYENDDISWETSEKANLGIELNFLSILDLNVDLYQEHRDNILLARSNVPASMGLFVTPSTNFGEAKSKGIDIQVDLNKNITQDWWVTGRANFTYTTSEFVKYDEPDYSATPWRSRIGQSLSQTYGYVAERLFVDENDVKNSPTQFNDAMAGDIKYKDINSDNVINEYDIVPIGYPSSPEIVYGFGFSTGYKGVDLSCFFQGLGRESFWISVESTSPFIDNDGTSSYRSNTALLKVYADDHWSETNRNTKALWPRLSDVLNNNNNQTSTWFMYDGSFLRLKSLEVGYSLPKHVVNKINSDKIRFYFSGTNLLCFSKFKLWDPEMAGNGLGYPVQKVFNLGVQVSF
ncbi:MAG: SusC/RagA family TonB-linked outer membrane protein [Mangrovibacterium sp.]